MLRTGYSFVIIFLHFPASLAGRWLRAARTRSEVEDALGVQVACLNLKGSVPLGMSRVSASSTALSERTSTAQAAMARHSHYTNARQPQIRASTSSKLRGHPFAMYHLRVFLIGLADTPMPVPVMVGERQAVACPSPPGPLRAHRASNSERPCRSCTLLLHPKAPGLGCTLPRVLHFVPVSK